MANHNLDQDPPKKEKENKHICSYSGQILSLYSKLQEFVVTVLLLTSTPLLQIR